MGMLNTLLTRITNTVKAARLPFPDIPALLLLCDIKNRSGISSIALGTSIISRLPEIGIPNGTNADGSENLINKFVLIVAEEVVKEIKQNGLTLSVAEPGSIKIEGIVVPSPEGSKLTGTNINAVKMKGLTQ